MSTVGLKVAFRVLIIMVLACCGRSHVCFPHRWLASIMPQGARQAARREKTTNKSYPVVDPGSYSNDSYSQIRPSVQ